MSSKSNARLPAEPLISIRMAFLRPSANRVASNVASAPPVNRPRKTRGVVDGDRRPSPSPPTPPSLPVAGGQRALLDEGLQQSR